MLLISLFEVLLLISNTSKALEIEDFFEFLSFHLESLIKEESLKIINFKNKKLLNYFLLREELQNMILQEKYLNTDKRQIILNLILKAKENT